MIFGDVLRWRMRKGQRTRTIARGQRAARRDQLEAGVERTVARRKGGIRLVRAMSGSHRETRAVI